MMQVQEAEPLRRSTSQDSLFDRLPLERGDPLLGLIGLYAADPRAGKIDLGVGVYKTEEGTTPVFGAVKAAERTLLTGQASKSYLGPEGDKGFGAAIANLIFGDADTAARLACVQTPGGTGALRLGAELLARLAPDAAVLLGDPTWPNHSPIFAAAGMSIRRYRHVDLAAQTATFDEALAALHMASRGDIVLLHGCCHNPTGVDFTGEQWERLAETMAGCDLLPLIDLAYQGLGDGLERDARGVRIVAQRCPDLLVAYSCDKNFGLYRERVGALLCLARSADAAAKVRSNLLSLARANWSMPPDHGAACVRIVLESAELTEQWRAELGAMRNRIAAMRAGLAALDPALGFIAGQKGMFSTLALSPAQVRELRERHGVYMADSGRINVAGLTPANLEPFAAALAAVR